MAHGILQAAKSKKPGTLIALWLIALATIGGFAVYLMDEKSVPRSLGLPYLIGGALALLISSAAITKFWREGDGWKVIVAQFAGAAALSVCLLSFAGKLSNYEDASAMFRALKPHLTPDSKVIQTSSFQPTAIFYMARPIYFVNFNNTSGLEEKALSASPFFPEIRQTTRYWSQP